MGYLRPVPFTGMSTWTAHRNRGVPSTEPGTDYYCPVGTPLHAAASGVVVDIGTSIQPATGYFITLDLDDGRRIRYLHLSAIYVQRGWRVDRGSVIGLSGATGYGEQDWSWNVAETGGAHVHTTLWRTQRYTFGSDATLDPEIYMTETPGSSSGAGGNSTPFEEDDMQQDERDALFEIKAALLNGRGDLNPGESFISSMIYNAKDTNNKVSIPGVNYGRPEVIQQRTEAILAMLGGLTPGGQIDTEALASKLREGLGAEIANELAERLAE